MVSGLTPELRKHFGAPADRGLIVARVETGSPAAKAGIAVGDVLVEVGGTPIDEAGDVIASLSARSETKPIEVSLIRDRKRLTLDVTPTQGVPSNGWLRDFMRRMFPNMPTTTT
jgi:serine protease Do